MHTRVVNNTTIPCGSFITLTYNDEHLPLDGSLNVKHWQTFAKRLRHRLGPFRFLHCGEYGPATNRPHYHACLFGIDFHDDRKVFKTDGNKTLWTSELLEKTWGKGFCTVGPLNYQTASYVAGYVLKKLNKTQWDYHEGLTICSHEPIALAKRPEYVTMSRNDGLGSTWFEKYWPEVYPLDQLHINGKTFRPPKYYDTLLERIQPCLYDQVMASRAEHLELLGPTSDLELRARKLNWEARFKTKTERLDL